ncbi:MAG TPA: PKD domain-containing protein [Thermoplasmata archaeon]
MGGGRVRAAAFSSRRGWVLLLAAVVLASTLIAPTIASHPAIPSPASISAGAPSPPAAARDPASTSGTLVAPRSASLSSLSSASVGSVVRTVFPGFNTSLAGSFTSSVSSWQVGTPAYVPSTDTIWFPQRSVSIPGVPFPTAAPVAVFNLTSGAFDGFVTNVSNSSAVIYDPGNGLVYATQPARDSVLAVNPRTGTLVGSPIPVGSDPDALAFDADSNYVFVANSGSANVTIINATDNRVSLGGVTVGTDPVSLVDDPHDGIVFVANAGSTNLSVINATSPPSLLSPIKLAFGSAMGLAYSPQTGNVVATIPSAGYATIIRASDQGVYNSVDVGKGVVAATTSANGSEFVLGNASGGDVVIMGSSGGTTTSTEIPVAKNATQLVLDPQSGIVYCWTSDARVLESVSLSSNSVVPAALTASPQLVSISYLQGQSQVYSASTDGSVIYALGPLQLHESSPVISTTSPPLSIVVDSAINRLFVGTADGLEVYNASSEKLIEPVTGLSGDTSQLVIDQPDNLLWLMNVNRGVAAVDLATDAVLHSTALPVSPSAIDGIAVAPSSSAVFVLKSPDVVEVLHSQTGDSWDTSIDVGSNVTSIVFDPADDRVYAAGDDVSTVNVSSFTVDGGPISLGDTHKVLGEVYEPSREDVFVATTGLVPGKQGTVVVLDGSSVSASEGGSLEIPVGEAPDAFGVISAGNGAAPGSAMIWVANELSGTVSVISSHPQITDFAASPSTIDLGYPTSMIVTYEGGAGPSTVTYYGLPPGCTSSDESQLNCTPSSAGVFTLAANVTDSFGNSANVSATLTVAGSLSILLRFSPSTFPDLDVGVPLVASASTSGGVPPDSYQWSFGDGTASSGPSASHTYSQPGVFLLTTEVRDSTGATNESSVVVTVVPPPSVGVSLTPGTITDVAIPISFNATVTGGTGTSQEKWTFEDGTEAVGPNTSHAWTHPDNYTVTFSYVDALGVTANRSVEVTVHPSLTATLTAGSVSSSNAATPGAPVTFTSNISGGTPPYSETWSFGDGSFASGLSVNHSYASTGTYTVKVTLTDAVGASVETNLSVTVASSSGGGLSAVSGGFGSGLFLGLVLGGVVAAVVLFAAGGRKGRRHPPAGPVSPYVPP